MILREAGRRLFHREGPITVKDHSCSIPERRERKDVAEKGNLMES